MQVVLQRLSRNSIRPAVPAIELTAHAKSQDKDAPFLDTDGDTSVIQTPPQNAVNLVLFCALIAAIALRSVSFYLLLRSYQCTVPGIEGILPLLVFLWECGGALRQPKVSIPLPTETSTGYTGFAYQQLGTASLITLGNVLGSRLITYPRSTVICPTSPGPQSSTLSLQIGGLLLDHGILVIVKRLLDRLSLKSPSHVRLAPSYIGVTLVVSIIHE